MHGHTRKGFIILCQMYQHCGGRSCAVVRVQPLAHLRHAVSCASASPSQRTTQQSRDNPYQPNYISSCLLIDLPTIQGTKAHRKRK